jgi:hypothetical protein
MMMQANSACDGMRGPTCGFYQDITCMAAMGNLCRTTCTDSAQCDASAFCDGRQCLAKKPNGEACANAMECTTETCNNGVCCGANQECCKTPADCKLNVDLKCEDPSECQGTKRSAACQQSRCVYGERVPDDSACTGPRGCGPYKDGTCDGTPDQFLCHANCFGPEDCDANAMCVPTGTDRDIGACQVMSVMAGSGAAGSSGGL